MKKSSFKRSSFLLFALLLCSFLILSPIDAKASKEFKDIGPSNDHYEGIDYLNQLNVYDDKTGNYFYPNEPITRKEVAKIIHSLFKDRLNRNREYEENPFKDASPSDPYYDSIVWAYETEIFDGDENRFFKGNEPLKRDHLAKILVNTFDLQYSGRIQSFKDVPEGHWAYDYIYTLKGFGISVGSNGSFMPNQYVTNGQFASFLYRTIVVTGYNEILSADGKLESNEPKQQASEHVLAVFPSEYDFVWNQIGKNERLELEGVNKNNEVVGFYSAMKGKELFGITIGKSVKADVQKLHGKAVDSIIKNNTIYNLIKDDGHAIYYIDGKYVTFFYDLFKNDVVRSVLWIDEAYEKKKEGYYGDSNVEARQEGYENLMIELMNQARAAEGIPLLKSAQQYREIARKHSMDMVKNHFFSHIGSDGRKVCDRMLDDGLKFIEGCGENLAAGAYNTIYAHEALMNSKGHRENILYGQYTHAFTGVAFDGTRPYWTINFYIAK